MSNWSRLEINFHQNICKTLSKESKGEESTCFFSEEGKRNWSWVWDIHTETFAQDDFKEWVHLNSQIHQLCTYLGKVLLLQFWVCCYEIWWLCPFWGKNSLIGSCPYHVLTMDRWDSWHPLQKYIRLPTGHCPAQCQLICADDVILTMGEATFDISAGSRRNRGVGRERNWSQVFCLISLSVVPLSLSICSLSLFKRN